ncbi:MAG TPA: M14 family zinc carboxypeptidase, partial [Candidatus Acidoferrales bacterium]|nr:M14 family zinc carboxypeptidase [Candidatus Acidoferrales bacterium]
MNPRMLFRQLAAVSLFVGLVLCAGNAPGLAQSKKSAAPAPQQNDADYTADIQKYTTEKYFSTELVDHLPASATVPSPKKVLGYAVGTEGKLTYTKDIYRYYRELAKASPRVKVWTAGKSEEGREFLLVAVTDESNMTQLDKFKQITARLADPRKISDAEAAQLIAEGKPIYWASGSIHSPETGSPEMLMELAYRLAVEDSPFIQNIRKNVIFLITPVVEVDGRDRMVDTYNYRKANPDKPAPGLIYWGKYVAHDNNRDSMAQALELSKVMMKNFLDWHPQVLHDLHESVPYLYTSTGTGPYNAWLDPIVISEWQKMAYWEIEHMTQRGVPGVWTHGFYDGWAANYMFYVANGHNSIGRFYETFGNGGADTRMRTLGAGNTARTWFRPNPPMSRVRWSIRNNVNMQQSALLFALQYTADRGKEFLENFYLKSKRSVAKAATEGPAAWVIPNDGKRPQLAAGLARLMQQQGAEVQTLSQEIEVKDPPPAPRPDSTERGPSGRGASAPPAGDVGAPQAAPARAEGAPVTPNPAEGGAKNPSPDAKPASIKIPAGSYVMRMDQPYSRMVDMLLDTQYYSTADPRPYDDTGWTMGPLRNVKTLRITDN